MNNTTNSTLLDQTLDSLADAPAINPWAPGAYLAKLTLEAKVINLKDTVLVNLTHIDTAELAKPTDTPPKTGDKTNIMLMLVRNDGKPNEISQGQLKQILLKLRAQGLPGATTKEMIEATKDGITVACVLGQRENTTNGTFNNTLVKFEVQG